VGHELDINISADGSEVTSFADSRTDAWHQLGQQVGHLMTAKEVLAEAHLANWNVRKMPTWTADDDGILIPIEDKFATVRTNPVTGTTDYLGVVGVNYTPIQNESMTDFLDALVDESGAHFETAGALRQGREVFASLKIPAYMEFDLPGGGTDKTDLYITALNSHDGGSAFKTIVTPVRVVCANTQAAALRSVKSSWSTRHTINALSALEQARDSLKLSFGFADAFSQEIQAMLDAEVDAEESRRLIESVFDVQGAPTERAKNLRVQHTEATLDGLLLDTCDGIRGTRYGLYNAVTEYIDHRIPVGTDQVGVAPEKQIFGGFAEIKMKAFDVLAVGA
jgi:phage/plasmid-like protein (TIGR03299 family)